MTYLSGRGTERARKWGERIRAAREARAWTQGDLGNAVGMTSNNVSRVELGKYEVPAKTRRRFAEVLGIPPADLGLEQPSTVRHVEPVERYPGRAAAIAVFREQSRSPIMPRDPELVERAVGWVKARVLESDTDQTVAWWYEALEDSYVALRRTARELEQDVIQRAKSEARDRTIAAQDSAAMRPKLPKR